ncbi:MAG: PAS domain S-box protein [Acidobacteria bacterium]|nr:PAS domain S-box protein [Acidobacteriota bacterium]
MPPSAQRLERVVASLGDVVIVVDSATRRIVDCNPAVERVLGFTMDELIGQSTAILHVDREAYERFGAAGEPILERDGVFRTESRMRRKDGRVIDTEHTVTTIDEGRGWRAGVVSVIRDVTERRRSEEALRERERQYRVLADNTLDVIWSMNMDLEFTYVNPAVASLTGYTPEEFVGTRLAEHCEAEAMERLLALLHEALKDDRGARGLVFDVDLRHKNGSPVPVEVHARIVYDEGGAPSALQGTTRDVSERRTLEKQLLQAQKMETVGRLAGGVAHDFNNMLSIILGNVELALEGLSPADPRYAHLQEILTAGRRSADLTRQLLAFARKQPIRPKVLDLDDTIDSVLKMLGRMISEDISLVWKPAGSLWPVRMDPVQVDQILVNLVVNARDAIGGAGTITIETARAQLDATFCEQHPGARPGRYVMLAVHDDGAGMGEETLARVFEPFFTTKAVGQGTGLGLPMVYGIVKQNEGYIDIESQPGRGTSVRIYLPPLADTGASASASAAVEHPAPGTETILLVEDEVALLRLTARLLERLGYTVLAAATPEAALELAKKDPRQIDLLVTDVIMPGASGRELWQEVAAVRPGLKCLFMSGYPTDVMADRGLLDHMCFLQKPFSAQALAAKVREALGA